MTHALLTLAPQLENATEYKEGRECMEESAVHTCIAFSPNASACIGETFFEDMPDIVGMRVAYAMFEERYRDRLNVRLSSVDERY